jgi:hypothetical protein
MEYVNSIKSLCKKDTRSIPEINHVLAKCLRALAKNPDWSVVQFNKTGQWFPIHINNYIADMEVHLNRYCKEIPRTNLDQIYRDTNAIINDIEHLCSNKEINFLRSWGKTNKISSVHLSVKDHKSVGVNVCHPTRLIVLTINFTQCLSKLASKSIEKSFRRANINFEKHTLKNSLAFKRKFKSMNLQWDNITIVSLDIKDMYPQCRFKAVKAAVRYYSSLLPSLQQEKVKQCLEIKFSMGNSIVSYREKYYEYGVDPDPDRRGLTIGRFESAFLADLEATYIFKKLHHLLEQHVRFIGTYHDNKIIVFRGNKLNEWLQNW